MAIFSRRVVQKCIDEIRKLDILPDTKLNKLIQSELNSSSPVTSIAFEWEVIIIAALGKDCKIEYEKNFIEGGTNPDIFCNLPSKTCFVADITTVSDRYAHKENPVDYFSQQVREFLHKKGLSAKGIDIRINGSSIGEYGNSKVKLYLPPKGEIPRFIKNNLSSFVQTISSQKSEPHQISIQDGAIIISYNPNDIFSGGSYPSYTSIYSLTRNPIFNRLEKKSTQLKKSEFSGITGILLCDGSCSALNHNATGGSEISQNKIIEHFFKSNQRISFIVTISIEERHSGLNFTMKKEKHANVILFANPNANHPITQEVVDAINSMAKHLPTPQSMPFNALRYLPKNQNMGLSYYGGWSMGGDTIKISSRTLVDILAGNLNVDKFIEDHFRNKSDKFFADHFPGSSKDPQINNFFKNKIFEGKIIEKIEVEKSSDADDDWIIIRFRESDPAISPFNMLKRLERSQDISLSIHRGLSIGGDNIKISSITIVGILAGNINYDKLIEDRFTELSRDPQINNFFKNKVFEGKMIEKIEVEQSSDEDDDWIIIGFGKSDSAISPYQ
jgi:hypothetical protein